MKPRLVAWLVALLVGAANLYLILNGALTVLVASQEPHGYSQGVKGWAVTLLALAGLAAAIVGLVVRRRPGEPSRPAWVVTVIAAGCALGALLLALALPS